MNKIKKLWGIGLIVVLLASMLLSVAPVSAGNWVFSADIFQPAPGAPGLTLGPAGLGILDVAQNGDIIYATGVDATPTDHLYKSTNGGATWAGATATGLPNVGAADQWGIVAVAPDDANMVVVVDTAAAPDAVYLSQNGGASFQALGAVPAGTVLNTVAISPLSGPFRFITVGGNDGTAAAGAVLLTWTLGVVAPTWAAPAGFVPATPLPAPANAAVASLDDVMDVDFSPNFAADQSLLVVTSTTGTALLDGEVALHVYSFNTFAWDGTVDVTFPRVLEYTTGVASTCTSADIELDNSFFLADPALQAGFVAADITVAAAQAGGVYRVGTYTVAGTPAIYTLTQIFTGIDVLSIAWDGTNLVAGVQGTATVWRSANALTPFPTFLQNSAVKAPSTGTDTLLLWSGSDVLAFTRGANGGVAKSTDNGRSFNGIALLNTNFNDVIDTWVSPDAAVTYLVVDDGTDINLWRKDGIAYTRVMILAGASTQTWLVRADADAPATVYLGRQAAQNMYYSTDSGNTSWTVRSASAAIRDFEVQDNNTIYVGVNAANTVVKSSNGGFTWGPPMNTGLVAQNVNDIALIADNQLLVGGAGGGVVYSTDGNASWLPTGFSSLGGAVVVAATGLGTGDTIFAAAPAAGPFTAGVNTFTIGTSVVFNVGAAPASADGIAYSNGVLYVLDNTGAVVHRFLTPTAPAGTLIPTDSLATGVTGTFVAALSPNSLQVSEAGTATTIWATDIVAAAPDTIESFSDYLTSPVNAPTPTYPINDAIIPVNSISGAVNNFVFQWNAPDVVVPPPGTLYNYNLEVYLDEAGTIPVAGGPAAAQIVASPAPSLSASAAALATAVFNGVPGETYYWRVRVDSLAPAQSYWSAMQSFTIGQVEAIVPVVTAPQNGAEINSTSPGFSWSPIANVTSYKFEISTNAAFATTIYTDEVMTAGAQLPVTIELEPGQQYFWRVKALAPNEGEWSTVSNFTVAEPAPEPTTTQPPITITTQPAPTITITQPGETTITVPAPEPAEEIAPAYIWAIIVIGAILVIAVIILIVRTRRSV